jgi:hypothetical protein
MLIALTLEKSQLSKLLIALTQGCRSDTRKHQELTDRRAVMHGLDTPQKCHFTLGFCMLNFSIVGSPWESCFWYLECQCPVRATIQSRAATFLTELLDAERNSSESTPISSCVDTFLHWPAFISRADSGHIVRRTTSLAGGSCCFHASLFLLCQFATIIA